MNSKHQLINYLNKFSQLYYLLNEYTNLKNLWMTTPDLWKSNERRLLCYLELNKSKSRSQKKLEPILYLMCQIQANKYL